MQTHPDEFYSWHDYDNRYVGEDIFFETIVSIWILALNSIRNLFHKTKSSTVDSSVITNPIHEGLTGFEPSIGTHESASGKITGMEPSLQIKRYSLESRQSENRGKPNYQQ